MKKILPIVTTTLAIGFIFSSSTVLASTPMNDSTKHPINEVQQEIEASNFINFKGTITDIKQHHNSIILIAENKDNSSIMHLPLTEDVLLVNNETTESFSKDVFEEGLEISVYYDKYKPVTMIYPPSIPPEIIVINENKMGTVKVSKFDKNLVSLDNKLQLHLSDETVLIDQQGKEITEDELYYKELLVFYTISTKSIPAQTTPSKIIALDQTNEQLLAEVQQIIEEDSYLKEGTRMIPIRQVAEHLGYEVTWDKGVLVSKENLSYTISIGKKAFGFNRSLRHFDVAPEIISSKTYVPEEFIYMLLNK
ncbi:copper amine oxidase N-terminal domain-containing protein [Bacillus sp. FJAT-45350]|uniref:copper amine oxidase N-terminal domain-containing protein n=1 Tax=Bacillus sp. FJAT-45350 TaxID=2011014 RepID=UPI000BB79DB0|nr:copper amine oxidase N-terminal domain-containing protein [Bacillus sp. FJAT-45350]